VEVFAVDGVQAVGQEALEALHAVYEPQRLQGEEAGGVALRAVSAGAVASWSGE
jgi:hypothetical protein